MDGDAAEGPEVGMKRIALLRESRDDGVQRTLVGDELIGMASFEREQAASVLEGESGSRGDYA